MYAWKIGVPSPVFFYRWSAGVELQFETVNSIIETAKWIPFHLQVRLAMRLQFQLISNFSPKPPSSTPSSSMQSPLPFLSSWIFDEPLSMSMNMKFLFTVATARLLVKMATSLHHKLRIARGLAPLSGPPGVWLLGNMPAYIKNRDRMYHFLVSIEHFVASRFNAGV